MSSNWQSTDYKQFNKYPNKSTDVSQRQKKSDDINLKHIQSLPDYLNKFIDEESLLED